MAYVLNDSFTNYILKVHLLTDLLQTRKAVLDEVAKVVAGKDKVIAIAFTTMLAGVALLFFVMCRFGKFWWLLLSVSAAALGAVLLDIQFQRKLSWISHSVLGIPTDRFQRTIVEKQLYFMRS